jgi:hypothetical protein
MQRGSTWLARSAATLPATIDATVIRSLTTFQKIVTNIWDRGTAPDAPEFRVYVLAKFNV